MFNFTSLKNIVRCFKLFKLVALSVAPQISFYTIFNSKTCITIVFINGRVSVKTDLSEETPIPSKTDDSTQTLKNSKKGKLANNIKSQKCRKTYLKVIIPQPIIQKKNIIFMDWKRFHKLNVINNFMDYLERDYPAICTVSVIGKSVEGRDIKMLKISNSNATNSGVWLDGSIHSREWITAAVVTYLADVITRNFHDLGPSITNKDWYIVPVLNPDGYEHTHRKDRMWRKNRAKFGGARVGVDLNRNFSYGWGNNGEEGSSEDPNNVFYRGPASFSEPESTAVRDVILGSTTQFQVFLSFHSYYELIIFPWGCKTDTCPDYLRLLEGGVAMSRAIYETSGMIYKVGGTKDMTYSACGTSTDWSYAVANIPYSYMIELRSRKYRFKLPRHQIEETCTEIWSAVKSLMNHVDESTQK